MQALLGIIVLLALSWLMSENREPFHGASFSLASSFKVF